MRWFFGLLVGFAAVALVFPILDAEAQDAKTEEKKEDEKKPIEKKVVRPDETTILASKPHLYKIRNIKTDPDKELTLVAFDPTKVPAFNQWDQKAKQQVSKDNQKKDLKTQKDRFKRYETDRDKEFDKVFAGEEVNAFISDICRIRSNEVPPKLNKDGVEEKLSPTQLANYKSTLKNNSKLPGYPVQFDAFRQGQVVEVYLPKPGAKKDVQMKKGPIGVDPALGAGPATVQPMFILIKEQPK